MNPDLDRHRAAVPLILEWVKATLLSYRPMIRAVQSLRSTALSQYFPEELLATTAFAVVDDPPVPPLQALGFPEFAAFETQPFDAVTYLNTYFVRPHAAADERLHFHELVHVIQWRAAGPKHFLLAYAHGLLRYGYDDSPLEKMAREHDARFASHVAAYDVEGDIRRHTLEHLKSLFGHP